jgi:SAM-dependent methyltransferase
MKELPDSYRWHIQMRKETSEQEALYIARMIKFFERKLKRKYSSVLDVPCGNGRLHTFLRDSGFEIFGIDNSRELIGQARMGFPSYENSYKKANMRNFDLKRKFDMALSWFASFGYFDDKGNLQTLKAINKHLKSSGLFFLDIPNAAHKIKSYSPIYVIEDRKITEITECNIEKIKNQTYWSINQRFYGRKNNNLKFIKKIGKRVRIYTRKEITYLLKKAGFKVIKIFSSMSFDEMTSNSKQMFIVSKKIP